MNILDIFRGSAFSVLEMSRAIQIIPNFYGRLNELNLFPTQSIHTTQVSIEREHQVLNLVPLGTRGGPPALSGDRRRDMIPFAVPHFALENTVKADEIQDVRAFGTENRLEGVMDVVNRKLEQDKRKHAQTLEFLRMGALKGLVISPQGGTIVDLFTTFGVTQKIVYYDFAGAPNVEGSSREVLRHMEDNLLGESMSGVHALCSPEFFDNLTKNTEVREAYKFFQSMADPLRRDPRKGFTHQGITYEEYRGQATFLNEDGTQTVRKFIDAGKAIAFPMGTQETFATYLAPADFIETVNTAGMDTYAKIWPDQSGRFATLHTQSNPLPICMRPQLIVELASSAAP